MRFFFQFLWVRLKTGHPGRTSNGFQWFYPLVMTHIAMEAMAHRNRWFTVLKNGWIFHGELLDNQMVSILYRYLQIYEFPNYINYGPGNCIHRFFPAGTPGKSKWTISIYLGNGNSFRKDTRCHIVSGESNKSLASNGQVSASFQIHLKQLKW